MPAVTKQALRAEAMLRRDATVRDTTDATASAVVLAEYAAAVCGLTSSPDPIISAYLAIGSELDPAPLVAELAARGATIALPIMIAKAAPLEFRAWSPGVALVDRMWGIREPGPDCAVVAPDILLVPLLLVDGAGNRLGYGGGYYDRTLAGLRARKNIIAIGVGFDEQRVDALPHEAYDQPLEYLLTPSGLHSF